MKKIIWSSLTGVLGIPICSSEDISDIWIGLWLCISPLPEWQFCPAFTGFTIVIGLGITKYYNRIWNYNMELQCFRVGSIYFDMYPLTIWLVRIVTHSDLTGKRACFVFLWTFGEELTRTPEMYQCSRSLVAKCSHGEGGNFSWWVRLGFVRPVFALF